MILNAEWHQNAEEIRIKNLLVSDKVDHRLWFI